MKIEEDRPSVIRAWTLWVLLAVLIAGISTLLCRLWEVQVVQGSRYGEAQLAQSLRRVELPGLRGRILDRNGEVLADNRPAYSVVLYCEELQQPGAWKNTIDAVDSLIDQLAQRLGLPRQVSSKDVRRHIRNDRPMPLVVWQDVDYRTVAYLSEWANELPGVAILPMSRRIYPNGALAAHLLGYVGRARAHQESQEDWDYRLPDPHGRAGIEERYDEVLSGTSGEELLRVDSRVYTRERWVYRKAKAGQDLTLTLDVKLQRAAEEALGGRPGAVVALDPRNGDVLVLASAPTYDLNNFIPGISSADWKALMTHPAHPLINRTIQAQYPPGSVFKPFVALAGQGRNFNADTLYECTGIYTDYNLRLRCANRYGHGELELRQAIMKSCNPYFCYMGTQVGSEAIAKTAEEVGFGARTGIDLPGEYAGLVPTPEWKMRRFHEKWRPTDTAQMSIGQGAVLSTPLQVANATAAIATGGLLYRPRLAAFGNAKGELLRQIAWPKAHIQSVVEGMEAAVAGGTGQTMQVEGISVAAKTGTAEYLDRGVRRKHVWSVAFAPSDKPEIVVCAMLDNGIGGGRDAGPIVQKVLAKHFSAKAIQITADDETLQD